MAFSLKRRAFLAGSAGAALGLPTLEAMLTDGGNAYAQGGAGLPKRFFSTYINISTGGPDSRSTPDEYPNELRPDTLGFDYDLKVGTESLSEVKDEVSIISNLMVGHSRYNSGAMPRAGISMTFHSAGMFAPQYCGVSRSQPAHIQPVQAPSCDHYIANAIGGGSPQSHVYYSVGNSRGFVYHPDGERTRKMVPVGSPQQAWSSLMDAYVPPDASVAAARAYSQERRQSVLDLVAEQRSRLVPQLGVGDRQRLDEHFTQVRNLEEQLEALSSAPASTCTPLSEPGPDSTFDDDLDSRMTAMIDLIFMAYACDISRVGLLVSPGGLNLGPLTGNMTLHDVTHNGPDKNIRLGNAFAWQNRHLARLIARMRDTMEGESSMLDNAVLTTTYEGGRGRSMDGDRDDNSHSGDNMVMLVAGRAGGLVPGQHIDAAGAHPAQVHLSAMRALGAMDDLGELPASDYFEPVFEGA